jgi:maltooligosyltrehalose trehalohydrolase
MALRAVGPIEAAMTGGILFVGIAGAPMFQTCQPRPRGLATFPAGLLTQFFDFAVSRTRNAIALTKFTSAEPPKGLGLFFQGSTMDQTLERVAVHREQEMKFGTQVTTRGVRFRLWAPQATAVSLKLYDPNRVLPMIALPRGWYELEVDGIGHGMRYRFVLHDGTEVPDPASRYQPEDVHGPSEVVDPLAYGWRDVGWRGRPWEEAIFYELHVGTFTPEGTFRAAIEKLDYLVNLGITAIELMPVADFAGRWNWGYDGAFLFAPDSSYGRPEDLKELIDEAHARNLMVFLDVVYNHFGPKGNYLSIYAPVMTEKHDTSWGPAVNFDDDGSRMIRDFVMANARYWLNEFHFDGLRFDAVHAIADSGPKHMLQDLAEQIRAATDGRHVHLVAENAKNQAGWLKRRDDGTPGLYTAQWSDDIHHLLHTAATGERFWYYADFAGRIDLLGRALAEGFAWQGEFMEHEGANKGEPSAHLPPAAFVSYLQNHDQIGNRRLGERISHLVPEQCTRTLAAIYLLSPQIPLLFMGEEWAAQQPFHYFSDVGEDLADAVRTSRQEELKDTPDLDEGGEPAPDPMAEETFEASKLQWDDLQQQRSARQLSLYKRLIALRHKEIVPRLSGLGGNAGHYEVLGEHGLRVWWNFADGCELSLVANLSSEPLDNLEIWDEHHLWLEGFATGNTLEPWSAVFRLRHAEQN